MSAIGPAGGSTTTPGTGARPGLRTREGERFEATLWLAMIHRNPEIIPEQEEPVAERGPEEQARSAEPEKSRESSGTERSRENQRSETQSREPASDSARAPGRATPEEKETGGPVAVRRGDRPAPTAAGSEKPAEEASPSRPVQTPAATAARTEGENAGGPSVGRLVVSLTGGLRTLTMRARGQEAAGLAQSANADAPAPGSSLARNASVGGTVGLRTSTIVVPFEETGGQEGRIRLALRGESLQATILSSNGETVQRLGSSLADLQRALGERGFTDARLTVRQSGGDENATSPSPSSRDPRQDEDQSGAGGRNANRDAGRQGARGRNWRGGRF